MLVCPWTLLRVATAASGGGLFVDLVFSGGAAPLGVAGDADGDEKSDAVEHRLDPERAAELLNAGDADRENGDADDRAPDIDAAGLDRGRAEEGADERGQQIFEADAGLTDPSLEASSTPATAVSSPEATKAATVYRRTGMPLSAAALGLAPIA